MAYTFKRWFREEYTFRGEKIGFELKHLTAAEEREVRARVVKASGAVDAVRSIEDGDPAEKAARAAAALSSIGEAFSDEFLRESFAKYVREVSNVVDEDGKVRTDGAVLVDIADDAFIWFVLLKLLGNGNVSKEEGKGSGSPSASASAATASGSALGATSTSAADGAMPSTAPEMAVIVPSGPREVSQ